MLFFRHPRPVIDGRAVAVQVVQQKTTTDLDLNVLVAPDHKPNQTDKTSSDEVVMTDVQVLEKHGGKSGDWTADIDR